MKPMRFSLSSLFSTFFFSFLFSLVILLPFSPLSIPSKVFAQEATSTSSTTPDTTTPDTTSSDTPTDTGTSTGDSTNTGSNPAPVQTIHVTVNVRYESAVPYTGTVTLTKGSTVTATDSSGSTHQIASDSVLAALIAADNTSGEFALSRVSYYGSFDSFYIDCVVLPSENGEKCHDWQYVVNNTYPPMGVDKYTVNDGDVVYFYFGTQRRVTVSNTKTDTNTPVTVHTDTYDYTNNTWNSLANTVVGATVPNPSDPYSPTVVKTVTTDGTGNASLLLTTAGSYGIGLAADYYASLTNLTVTDPMPVSQTNTSPSQSTSSSGGHSSSRVSSNSSISTNVATEVATTSSAVPVADVVKGTTGDPVVILDIPIEQFIAYFKTGSVGDSGASNISNTVEVHKNVATEKVTETAPEDTASVVTAIDSLQSAKASTTKPEVVKKDWFSGILSIFGF